MDFSIAGLPASAVIVALVEGAKRAGLPARLAPALALLLGVAWSVLTFAAAEQPRWRGLLDATNAGVVLGLIASGLYSATKTTVRLVRTANG